MGLDMFLKRMEPMPKDEKGRTCYMQIGVAYWRKANAVHGWFDRHFDGIENCVKYELEADTLQELVDNCKTVLEDHSKAEELLPPMRGFFYGTYEYDEPYFDDLEETVKMLTEVLEEFDGENGGWYEYHAWW